MKFHWQCPPTCKPLGFLPNAAILTAALCICSQFACILTCPFTTNQPKAEDSLLYPTADPGQSIYYWRLLQPYLLKGLSTSKISALYTRDSLYSWHWDWVFFTLYWSKRNSTSCLSALYWAGNIFLSCPGQADPSGNHNNIWFCLVSQARWNLQIKASYLVFVSSSQPKPNITTFQSK